MMHIRKVLIRTCFLGTAVLKLAGLCHAQDPQQITLKQAVSLALANSRELALARARIAVEQGHSGVLRSEFSPVVYTGSGVAYTNGFPQTQAEQAPTLFQANYSEVLLNLPLREQIRAEQDGIKSKQIELERVRDGIILKTATSYLDLANVRHEANLLSSERSSARAIVEVSQERLAEGLELPIEVTRGELALAKIEQQIVRLKNREAALNLELRNLTATPFSSSVEIVTEDVPDDAEPSPVDSLRAAAQTNGLLRLAENESDARRHILSGERAAYWPTASLIGQYSVLSKINNYEQFFRTFQRNNVSLGILVRIPLLDRRIAARVKSARSELNEAELNAANLRQETELEAEQKQGSLLEENAGLEVARLDLKVAQENLALVQARFDEDHATLKELEQVRLEESEKWMVFLDANFARNRTRLAWMEATGRLAELLR